MRKLFSKLTYKSFLIYFSIIFVVSSLLTLSVYSISVTNEQREYTAKTDRAFEAYAGSIEDKFENITRAMNLFFSARWYTHYITSSEVYSTEFDPLSRSDISRQITRSTIGFDFIDDVMIVVPEKETVINSIGWFSFSDYEFFFGDIGITMDQDKACEFSCLDERKSFFTIKDYNLKLYPAYICVVLNKPALYQYFEELIDENMEYFAVYLDNDLIYEYGTSSDNTYALSRGGVSAPKLLIEAEYESFYSRRKILPAIILLELFILTISVTISLFLLWLNIFPLDKLIKKVTPVEYKSTLDAYRHLDTHIETISADNERLQDEYNMIDASMRNIISMYKNEYIFSMLTNPDFDFNDEYILSIIPWVQDRLPFILIIADRKDFALEHSEKELASVCNEYRNCELYRLLTGEYLIILWSRSWELNNSHRLEITSAVSAALNNDYFVVSSRVMTDPYHICGTYIQLKEELLSLRKAYTDLPLTLQIQLINKILRNSFNDCCVILNEARNVYTPDAFFTFLLKLSREYGIDVSSSVKNYERYRNIGTDDELWNVNTSLTSDICKHLSDAKRKSYDNTAALIKNYIDKNYASPDMSLKKLSDRFSIDSTLISRVFKIQYSMNFSEYLLEKRIHKSIRLMKSYPDMNLSDISEQTGYTNYLSFKRAFIRYQGIAPKEYRDML
ncbi:MAG: helix-turn-helix transcriptional regulator [Clostridiales bacterium]|nr:helix-turn-helix transcriptional regulator [Clostridiales bacterium]